MSVSERVLRELGARTRKQRSTKAAVLFYRDDLARRLSVSIPLEYGVPPKCREERECDRATAAMIAKCLAATHPADETIRSTRMLEQLPLSGEKLLYLVAWYENTEESGEDLARKWAPNADGNPVWRFIRWCRITERVIGHRLEWAKLLE